MSGFSFLFQIFYFYGLFYAVKEEKDERSIELLNNYFHTYFYKVFILRFVEATLYIRLCTVVGE